MDALDLARLIFDTNWVRFIAALIAANVLLGLGVALFSKRYQFYLASTGDWLLSRVVPYVIGWAACKLVAVAAFADFKAAADATEAAVSLFVIAALLGKIADLLREMGMPLPRWAGDKPKAETTVSP